MSAPLENYKATIFDPGRLFPKPDKYDTLTIPAQNSMGASSPVPLRSWAHMLLPGCTKDAYCVIERTERVEVERITREEVINAAADK
jgi:hypothetical protein